MPENMLSERESDLTVQRTLHPRVLGMVLAGGKGTRLSPLTGNAPSLQCPLEANTASSISFSATS